MRLRSLFEKDNPQQFGQPKPGRWDLKEDIEELKQTSLEHEEELQKVIDKYQALLATQRRRKIACTEYGPALRHETEVGSIANQLKGGMITLIPIPDFGSQPLCRERPLRWELIDDSLVAWFTWRA